MPDCTQHKTTCTHGKELVQFACLKDLFDGIPTFSPRMLRLHVL